MKNKVLVKDIVDMPEKKEDKGYIIAQEIENSGYNYGMERIGNLEINPDKLRELGWVKGSLYSEDKRENIIDNPKSWVAWKDECERLKEENAHYKAEDYIGQKYVALSEKYSDLEDKLEGYIKKDSIVVDEDKVIVFLNDHQEYLPEKMNKITESGKRKPTQMGRQKGWCVMEIIKITKYGVYSYGVKPHVNGSLLGKKDVEEILIHILDDDELVKERVIAFLNELQKDGK